MSLSTDSAHALTNIDATTEIISISSLRISGNGISHAPALSADGRFVAFVSEASNLVPGDTNNAADIFVHDRWSGLTKRVSITSNGAQASGDPSRPSISGDGRFVAFSSDAPDLVTDDNNAHHDVFLHDRDSGATQVVSISSTGELGNHDSFTRRPSLSYDGRLIVFFSAADNLVPGDSNGVMDVFLHDRLTGATELISKSTDLQQGNADSSYPTISSNGNFIAYYSDASNLVENDLNGSTDVFLYNRLAQTTTRVSISNSGEEGNDLSDLPSISADGRFVAFFSLASNLVAGDTNGKADIFVRDTHDGLTRRASVASDGSQANGLCDVPSLSADGRYIAFYSFADNLVPGDDNGFTDVFRHDFLTGETIRISIGASGTQGTNDSLCSAISADGQVVGFYSYANNLIPEDNNNQPDVFIRDLSPQIVFDAYFPIIMKPSSPDR